jgi:hypothetical protein
MSSDAVAFPHIAARRSIRISPWVELIEKTVRFSPGGDDETYHCVTQAPYVGMLVHTCGGYLPIVR